MNDTLKNLQAELERQNEAFRTFEQTLVEVGDVAIEIPPRFLSELDELCTTAPTVASPMLMGIRG